MALVAFRNTQFTLSSALQDIGEVYDYIQQQLPKMGYTSVTRTDHVFAGKGGNTLVVYFLLIGGRNFWQTVISSGDAPQSTADAQIAEVQTMIAGMHTL
jgi:hypothetical protein